MESHCLSGALHVVLMLNIILEFSWMSAPSNEEAQTPTRLCVLDFPAFYLPWRWVSAPDYKAPPERCFIPIPLVSKANCEFCNTLTCLCRFPIMWWVSLERHTNLPAQFCRVWHCFNIMLHFTYHEVFANEAALSPLTPTSSPQSTPHSAEDQDIQDMHIFPRVTHNWFLLWFKYLMLCFILSQIVLFFSLRRSLSCFEEKLSLVVHIQHDYWTQKYHLG